MSWFNWVDPVSGLILAACVIPPLVLLYFLKLRRRSQPIACTLLWRKSVEDLRANAPFQRLRKSLLLLLQLLALIMLALALMQPQLLAGRHAGGNVIIMIDNSASMNATDTGQPDTTRLDVAKDEARRLIDTLDSGGIFGGGADRVMIIGFNENAQVYSNFTSSHQQLMDAIDAIQPTQKKSSIDEALELARAHTTIVDPEQPDRSVIEADVSFELFTDGRIPDFAEQAKKGERLSFFPLGSETPDNVAFSSVAVERPFDDPANVQVFAGLLNFNPTDVTCTVQLAIDGNVQGGWIREVPVSAAQVDESTGAIVPGRSNVIFGPFPQPQNSVIEVSNLRADDLQSDNIATLVTPPPRNLRVAIVEPKSFLTETALSGMPLRARHVLSEEDFLALREAGGLDQYDVYILEDVTLDELPPGRYLSMGTPLPVEGFEVLGRGEGMFIPNWDQDHPALRYVDLDNLFISKFLHVSESSGFRTLADGSSGTAIVPAMVEYSRGAVHAIFVAFNHYDTNWPWHQSFVIFLMNTIEYLGTVGEAFAAQDLKPGDALTTRLPAGAGNVRVGLPDGDVERIEPAAERALSFSDTERAGLYTVLWDDAATGSEMSRLFAFNQFDELESDIRRGELVWGGDTVASSSGSGVLQTPLWPWAIGLCLLVLMLEWWVYHRRAHV